MAVPGHIVLEYDVAGLRQMGQGRPFYPKRSHKKSKKGCTNCKARKVKCDEARPTCRTCLLREDVCVYGSPTVKPRTPARRPLTFVQSSYNSSQSPSSASVTSSPPGAEEVHKTLVKATTPSLRTSCPLGTLSPTPQLFDVADLKLLWNYTMKTNFSFIVDEDYQALCARTYSNEVVGLALENQFLLNSIMTVSALELHHTNPRDYSIERAHNFYVQAIEGYGRAIREARPETFPAILINIIFVALMTSRTFRDPEAQDLYICDWLEFWRGMTGIIDFVGFDIISESGLAICLYRPPIDPETAARAVPDYLSSLIAGIPPWDEDYTHIPAYEATLRLIGSLYHHLPMGMGADFDYRISAWLSHLPKGFATVAQQRRPRALIILAHYLSFYRLVRQLWWTIGIAERSLSDIFKHIGPEWHPWLRMPMAVHALTDNVEIARTILGDPDWVNPKRPRAEIGKSFLYVGEEDERAAASALLQEEQDKDNEQDVYVNTEISRQMSRVKIA